MNDGENVVSIRPDEGDTGGRDVDTILENPKIKDILARFPSYRDNIKKAARILAGEENAVQATLEAARAIINRRINVFFSYKSHDEDSAREIVEELRFYAADKLKITFAGEFSEEIPGARWGKEIRDAIHKAHWFILLLPDPSAEWDWCLFETGMFSAKMVSDKVNKLICLHHPAHTKLPSQISEFHKVKAEPADIEAFLTKIFVKDNPVPGMAAINPAVRTRLPQIAAKIVSAVKPRHLRLDRHILDRYVLVKIPDAENLSRPEDLEAAQILEIDDQTLGLFGKVGMPRTWAELIENVTGEDYDNRWLRELAAAVQKAAGKNAFGPIQATFKGANSGKLWRPLLHAIDKSEDGEIESFMILFLEEIGAGLTHHVPESTQALISCLRLTFRFRWEVINRYRSEMTVGQIQEFKDSLDRIETEGKSRGIINEEILLQSFGGVRMAADRVRAMFREWAEYRTDERTGKLDIAIREKNVKQIQEILNKMAVMNAEFVIIAIERMETLMQSD